jgi:NNP family nitrate/nitrite transporter-like MFS transporter
MGLATIPVLLALAAFTFLASDSPTQPPPKHLSEYVAVLKVPDTWWLCFFYSITFGGFLALVNYLAIFFNTAYGVDKVKVGVIVAIASLFGSALRPLGGYVSDRAGGINVVRVAYVAFAVCAFVIATAPPLLACEVVVFCAVGLLGIGNGAIFQIVPQRFGTQIGIVTGIVGAAGGLGGFYLPNVLGQLRAITGTFASGFITFGAIALAGAVGITFVAKVWKATFLARAPGGGLPLASVPLVLEG